jgi:hypothetical protein
LHQNHLLELGLMQIHVGHAPLSTTCHVGLHVDFFIHELFFRPIGLHLLVCPTLLHEECPKYHGHKGDPGVTPKTCGAVGERVQMIVV